MKHTAYMFSLAVVAFGFCKLEAATGELVTVRNAGNSNDSTGFGSVAYEYSIGKYEVTIQQYTAFLNAVAATDTYGLYNTNMGTDANSAGISRAGTDGSYTYTPIGSPNRPITYVSWFDAARFTNWLHNGQPTGGQTAETTEDGAYNLSGAISGSNYSKKTSASWWIPSENEWYKAAYHQPASSGGDADNYWLYPTGTNSIPNSRNGSTSDPNSANYYRNVVTDIGFNDGYAVSGSINLSSSQQYLTDVGAFTLSDSYYGTFDQGGNVWEWNDAVNSSFRGLRGGTWGSGDLNLQASFQNFFPPTAENSYVGFRVATIPEPAIGGLIFFGMAVLAAHRCRKSTL